MAGLRQGLALLHPQGRNAVEDGADRGFLSREDWAKPRGRNFGLTVAARGKRRSRPLPTKAIDEAVGERGSGRYPLGDLARVGCYVQCRAGSLVLRN
jgi:hypothetical protein